MDHDCQRNIAQEILNDAGLFVAFWLCIYDSFGCKLWQQSIENHARDHSQAFAHLLEWLCSSMGI